MNRTSQTAVAVSHIDQAQGMRCLLQLLENVFPGGKHMVLHADAPDWRASVDPLFQDQVEEAAETGITLPK